MKFLAHIFKRLSRRQRLERAMRDCDERIRDAIDHINFGRTMLRTYEKKHARLALKLARLDSPDDVARRWEGAL
jgi:hypothetical protein